MLVNSKIIELYEKIRNTLFYMIPERWDSIYLYATVISREKSEETGEMFFYYFPKGILKKNPINVYQIPQRFNIEEKQYLKLTDELYDLIRKLRRAYIRYEQINWSNITISIKNVNFLVEYNCENLLSSKYTSSDRIAIWQYRYLNFPLERFDKEQRQIIQNYMEEKVKGLHEEKTYSDSFYKPHIHNNIQYDVAKDAEKQYIKVEDKEIEEQNEDIIIRNQILMK